jgi:hypothetical protein
MKNALATVTTTRRESESLLINFRAEVECGRLIKEVSEIINNKASYQLRYLNMVQNILLNGC